MKLLQVIIITIHLTGISSKKRRKDVSSESIENILYYQDCNHHKQIPQQPTPLAAQRPLPQQPPQQQCKMCCTMCCGDQCVDSHQQLQHQPGRQLFNGQIEPKSMGVIQPGRLPPRERRKKDKFPLPMKPPLPGRRGMGFTRENIKSLISQDEDIKKILKDLVRVTMQKVDLMQLMEQPGAAAPGDSPPPADVSVSQNDL